jgi:hypothetical protein
MVKFLLKYDREFNAPINPLENDEKHCKYCAFQGGII